MAALSPRSANIQLKPRATKQKEMTDEEAKNLEAAKKALKEKDYAPPPPEWVFQPPIAKGGLAEKYRTGRCLGKGGFAICYEAELKNKRSGNEKSVFALKIVKAIMNQRKMEEKFRTELQIHAKMRHPNIVEFHRAFTFKESTYVVLELCSNGSIMDMVKKRRCLTLPEVRRLTIQLCGAIKYMHARNVIHRDLKMGNLFLDHDMNLKIGDFGLAACLVSKEELQQGLYENAKSRRTTLCGTPNYIAPEILEKGKGGHDHKVDIWAIGVIVFAMLSGQPPFQSASQNEIYRKARGVEYEWPQESKYSNDIPEEAKDLVAKLLKVDAEERPDPDQIVGHPFFSMHGGNAMPLIMEEHFTRQTPHCLNTRARPRGDVMIKGTELLSVKTLAQQCGVGRLSANGSPQPNTGGDSEISLYSECLAEENAGASPIIPLPKDMVYTSNFLSKGSQDTQAAILSQPRPSKSEMGVRDAVASMSGPPADQIYRRNVPEPPRRTPVQSHAATLRAAHVSSRTSRPKADLGNTEVSSSVNAVSSTVQGRHGLLTELPVRPNAGSANAGTIDGTTLGQNSRVARARQIHKPSQDQERDILGATRVPKSLSKDHYIDEAYPDPDQRRRDLAARTKVRIASNVQKEMANNIAKVKEDKTEPISARPGQRSESPSPGYSLIGPNEVFECLSKTKPDDVLRQLRNLHKELDFSHQNFTTDRNRKNMQEIDIRNKSYKYRPVVVKWVDYTNKFGIGYILANGTVGTVFKGDETSRPTCVIVADAESHLKKRKASAYPERHQIIPKNGAPIEFVENCAEEGLKRVLVQPSVYQVKITGDTAERLGPGLDVHDYEKRKKLCLWDKFGKYMTQTLGKGDDADILSEGSNTTRSRLENVAGPFVKFYQRLGNIGVWGFGDGSFQFNFPDHTKLVVSEGGSWLDFYHLPIPAAQSLKAGRFLEAVALAERSVLCYPTAVMLTGSYNDHDFRDVIRENELSAKVGFIKDVVGVWATEGGLGCMGGNKGVKWEGMRESGGKLVWVTIGAKGGDGRYEMPASRSS